VSATILFCEDDPTISKLIQLAMRKTTHRVLMAINGREGLEMARQHKPDLIVTDLSMPEMNGIELFDKVRADPELKSTPMAFLTASTQRSLIHSARTRPSEALLVKPFSPSQLRAQIEVIMADTAKLRAGAGQAGGEIAGPLEAEAPSRGTILMIEDGDAADLMVDLLTAESYEPILCRTAAEGLQELHRRPTAILLDWGLPDRPGLEVCREIRALDQRVPILFVSGRNDEASVARALDAGANDFIIKPFRPVEFIARVEAQIRRSAQSAAAPAPAEAPAPASLTFGNITVDLRGREVKVAGIPAQLGAHEFKLVEYLVQNAGVAISRDQIMEHVYGYGSGNSTERVDMLVRRVRSKLNADERLTSVPGYGFRWERRSP
jgi:two-component system, OmpR family, alkaline phosphatase synthesis response regulator PhoP